MKTDGYTKAMLTVIAVCLSYFVLKDFIAVGPAQAQAGPVSVNIVKIAGMDLLASNVGTFDAALPVKIMK